MQTCVMSSRDGERRHARHPRPRLLFRARADAPSLACLSGGVGQQRSGRSVCQGDNATTGGNGIARADVASLAIAALSDEAAHRVTVEVVDAAPAAPAVEGQAGLFFKRLLKDAE